MPPPGGSDLRCRQLCRSRKSLASGYYQLFSGHAAIGSFLHERMTGPQRLESSECWWCNYGKRQSCYHIFTECRAWAPQIRKLWRRIGRDCHWEGRRRLAGYGRKRPPRRCWTRGWAAVGCRLEGQGWVRAGTRRRLRCQRARSADRARPRLYFPLFLSFVFYSLGDVVGEVSLVSIPLFGGCGKQEIDTL